MRTSSGAKHHARQLLLYGVNLFGLLSRQRRVPIITYHSLDNTGSCISSTKEHFAWQMEFLSRRGYETLTSTECVDMIAGERPIPSRAVALTFDDGLENNYSVAFPILQKYGLTATVFLATDYIGGKSLWDRRLDVPCLPLMT